METTRKIIIGVAIAAIAFFIIQCDIGDKNPILSEEESFLAKNALLPNDTFMVQTVTRFFKDVATQKLYLDELTTLPPNLDSLYTLSDNERAIFKEQIKTFGALDNQYIKRLETILKKRGPFKKGDTFKKVSTMLMPMPPGPGDDRVKPCPCPPEVAASVYCEWKEEDVMPIIVDTAQWKVTEIRIESFDPASPLNTALIATSTNPQTQDSIITGGTYVLYRLVNEQGEPITPGTYVNFKVTWLDDQEEEVTTSLIIRITAGATGPNNR